MSVEPTHVAGAWDRLVFPAQTIAYACQESLNSLGDTRVCFRVRIVPMSCCTSNLIHKIISVGIAPKSRDAAFTSTEMQFDQRSFGLGDVSKPKTF